MDRHAALWDDVRTRRGDVSEGEGLRERKKRLMREYLSNTATDMFLERGFDEVRVSDIAEACGVSEKTVFNYFPTKEALFLDHWDETLASLQADLEKVGTSPVEAMVGILDRELEDMMDWVARQKHSGEAAARFQRFGELVRSTPSLRAHQQHMMGQLVRAAAAIMARRTGLDPDDPEPRIAAMSLLGLWEVQFHSLWKHLDGIRTGPEVYEAVSGDVHRAARLIHAGLRTFGGPGQVAEQELHIE